MQRSLRPILLLGLLVPGLSSAQRSGTTQKPAVPEAAALQTAGLAGQLVAVLPLTMVVSDPKIPGGSGAAARATLVKWADSSFSDVLLERAPEVQWVLPPALRKAATRSGGLIPSPDRMGQSVMRSPGFKDMPDPLRSYVRQLVALAGGARYALIPAALWVTPTQGDSLRVELAAVLTDARVGRVMWRTHATGSGETMAEAFRAALNTILPSDPQ